MLAFVFNEASMPVPDATAEPEAKGGILGGLFGQHATDPKAPVGKTATERKEQDVQAASRDWQDVATAVLIMLMVPLVGDDLKPTNEQAAAITAPLVRIAMRHYDPLRESSNDMKDAITAAVMFSMYLQGIWPILQQRRADRKLKAVRGNATLRPVPVERPAGVATAQPAADGTGHDQNPLRGSNGAHGETGGRPASNVVPDAGLAALEAVIGTSL